MEKQKYTGKHRNETNERFTPLKRATAASIASLALVSTLYSAHEGADEAQRRAIVAEVADQYVSHDNEAKALRFSPDYTLIIPAAGAAARYDARSQFTDEAQLRAEGKWCDTPDIPLFQKVTTEQIDAASEIKMGLDVDQYEAIAAQLDSAKTIPEAEAIAKDVYEGLGIELTFNDNINRYNLDPVKPITESPKYELNRFVSELDEQIASLTVMPKEMIEAAKRADLIFADSMYSYNDDGSKHYVAGVYNANKSQVTVRLGAGSNASIHEWAHALHHKACNEFTGGVDGGFEAAYNQAVKLMKEDPKVQQLEKAWPENGVGGKEWYSKAYFDETGFPTKYSKERYGELFADTTATLLTQGTLTGPESGKTPQAEALQQLVVDRLQKALPHTDVASLVAARSVYPDQGYGSEVFQAMLDHHVSRLDRIFAGQFGKLEDGGALIPAINIKSADGALDEILYSYQRDVIQTPEGRDGGEYTMSFLKSQDKIFDKTLVEMSLKYLQQTAAEKHITLTYEAREFDGSYYILGFYEKDGSSSAEPEVKYTTFTESPILNEVIASETATGTGG
jgi:hypothetical protein